MSLRSIARTLKRPASTISREVRRNGGLKDYRAATSDAAAWDRAHRPKPCKLAGNAYLCRAISAKLIRKWSPQQIASWLMREHPKDEGKCVSHETIYRSLFIQTRGVLKKELLAHLRATRAIRLRCCKIIQCLLRGSCNAARSVSMNGCSGPMLAAQKNRDHGVAALHLVTAEGPFSSIAEHSAAFDRGRGPLSAAPPV